MTFRSPSYTTAGGLTPSGLVVGPAGRQPGGTATSRSAAKMFGMYEEHDEVMDRRQVAFEALFGEGGSGHRTLLHRLHGIRDVRPGDTADTEWVRSVLHWQLLLDRWQCLDEVRDLRMHGGRARRIDVLACRIPGDVPQAPADMRLSPPSPMGAAGEGGIDVGLFERLACEIKVSRGDFLSDVKDRSKQQAWRDLCHQHYYVAPAGLIRADEVPEGSGLLEVVIVQQLKDRTQSPALRWTVPAPVRPAPAVPDWLVHQLVYRASHAERLKHERVEMAPMSDADFAATGWRQPEYYGLTEQMIDEHLAGQPEQL